MAKTNIFTKAKSIRKAHPRLTWQECVSKAAGKTVGKVPAKKIKVSGAKRKVSGIKRKFSGVKAKVTKTIGRLDKGLAIVGKINGLESRYKKAKGKEIKHLLALEINAQHDILDNLKRQYKKVK